MSCEKLLGSSSKLRLPNAGSNHVRHLSDLPTANGLQQASAAEAVVNPIRISHAQSKREVCISIARVSQVNEEAY